MKLTKTEFRQMLKECILELVEEGKLGSIHFGNQQTQQLSSPFGNQVSLNEQASTNETLNNVVQQAARAVAKSTGKDKLYEALFAETARTTLQERINAERGGGMLGAGSLPATPQEIVQDQQQLQNIPGVNKWAMIAFGKKS